MFFMLVVTGGSAFAMIEVALGSMPPALVTFGRLSVAGAFCYLVLRAKGGRLPPLLEIRDGRRRLARAWPPLLAVAFIGYVIPFFIFPWAQQTVESGLAGVYMAFMPLWTLVLAFLFAGETLTRMKIAGFLLGLVGVFILMGPDVVAGVAQSSLVAQAGLLFATLCYAVSVVISRRYAGLVTDVNAFAAASILPAALMSAPALLFTPVEPERWRFSAIVSVLLLGVLQTGLAGIVIFAMVKRVGAGFMALANYLTPVFAVILGAALFHERLQLNVFIALGLILAGVAISQHAPQNSRRPDMTGAA
jgi:drug/metabolite transporter (DMT)-like permease